MQERQSKTGKPYWTIHAGGEFYNVWDTMVKARITEGETYTLMVESNASGDKVFHNVVGIGVDSNVGGELDFDDIMPGAQEMPATPPPAPKPVYTTPIAPTVDPMIVVRQTALECAVAMLVADKVTQKSMNILLRKFEGYIIKGTAVEQISSSLPEDNTDLSEFVANE